MSAWAGKALKGLTLGAILVCGIGAAATCSRDPLPAEPAAATHANGALLASLEARPDFFPFGVWLQSPARLDQYRAIGVNVFVGLNGDPTADDLARFARAGVYMIARPGPGFPRDAARGVLLAWLAKDEPDNAQRLPGGGFGPCIPAEDLVAAANAQRAADGMPIFQNFGRGVAVPDWKGRGSCAGDDADYYPQAVGAGDIDAFDVYPVASADGKLELVAQGTRNLKRWIGRADTPQWSFIEAAPIFGGAVPTPAQVRAMAWMAITNGSRGIVLFPWQLTEAGKRLHEDGLFAYPALVAAVRDLGDELRTLAPVINAGAPLPGAAAHSDGGGLSMMARRWEGADYLFAVSESPRPLRADFTLPGVTGERATVLGEQRTVAVSGGRFTDTFAPYAVHLYTLASR